MTQRTFLGESALDQSGLGLALAPALTPAGVEPAPSFFSGFSTQPQVLARGLVTLAEITATRYFMPVPTRLMDPVLTAHGDRLRAEVFSACNGVYARLDITQHGLDGGEITHGTTNVDIGPTMRSLLTKVGRSDALHLDIGRDGLRAVTPGQTAAERPVRMPDRWVRALGNAAQMHHGLVRAFEMNQAHTRAFLGTIPTGTSRVQSGWITPSRTGLRLAPRPSPGAVFVAGLHRLSALRRLLTHVTGLRGFGPADGSVGPAGIEVLLPGGSLFVGLTQEPSRGFSGEGALLLGLASSTVLDDADLVSVSLAFEPVIDEGKLARESGLSPDRVRGALAVLAASGRIGWDAAAAAWFHRELPDDPDRVLRDNPRLVGARKLVEAGAATPIDGAAGQWSVRSAEATYLVNPDAVAPTPRCTCRWVIKHGTGRGPCKHQLAVILTRDGERAVDVVVEDEAGGDPAPSGLSSGEPGR